MDADGLSVLTAAREPNSAKRIALLVGSTPLTYEDLASRVEHYANGLAAEGIGPGSRVAMRAACDVNTVVTFFALLELGAAFVPLHPRLTEAEVTYITKDVRPDLVLEPLTLSHNPARSLNFVRAKADPSTPLAILYTSGTTGRP